MTVLDDRLIAPRIRLASVAADLAAPAATVFAFGFLFAITLGVL
ncbi:hypothetical protein [Rhizobium mesoamericanum]|nr:hypothetical protein [Rhizobium mesoamericanum]